MKYIRTKNAIIPYSATCLVDSDDIGSLEIIKQADTIEELCDEIIGIRENSKPVVQTSYTKLNPSLCILRNDLRTKEIYGAIWTKWGLRFVAKMNEKGEFELL